MRLNRKEIKTLKQCTDKHRTIEDLFNCESCKLLFKKAVKNK